MPSLSQARTLGGIGSILTLLLIVLYFVGTGLVILGWIPTFLALRNSSDTLGDRSIFNNAIISIGLAILGTAIFAVVVAGAILGFVGLGGIASSGPPVETAGFFGLIAGVIIGLVVCWVLAITSSFFLMRTYRRVGTDLNIGLFKTGATLYLIGSILTIIIIGFVLIFIAQIIFIVAFFSLPNHPPPSSVGPPSSPSKSPPPPSPPSPTMTLTSE